MDVSSKTALKRVDDAINDLVTVMAREGQRPLSNVANWVVVLDNRYYEGGELVGATISLVPQPSQPYYVSEMLIQNAYQGMATAEYQEVEDEDVDDEYQ